ncbi:MAG: TRAP transporter substrate-binding protein [bacterium]|nr:TRAP transporter substrate-binding protein [bacterium]
MKKLLSNVFTFVIMLVAFSGWAIAEPIVIKFGFTSEGEIRMPGTGRSAGAIAFKDFLEVNSDGRIKVELYPNGTLGNNRTLIESAQTGVIQMVGAFTSIMAPFAPEVGVTQIPYMFENNLIAWKVMEGPFGKEMAESFLKKTGLRVLGWPDGSGYRHIYSEKPIKSVADLKGMKMRVPENPGLLAMFRAWGAKTVTITWQELYSSLQTGMAEGCDTELYSMYSKKLYEVNPYVTMTRHSFNLHPYMINEAFFQSLSKEDQTLVLQAADLCNRVANGHSLTSSLLVKSKMEEAGAKFYYPTAAQIAEFKRLGQQPYIDMTLRKIGEKEGQMWLEKLNAAIKKAESEI